MIISVGTTCPFCHKAHYVDVDEDGFLAWESGALIQDALPTLGADEREMLISGICPKCWDGMFDGDEDEIPEDDADLECGFDPYEGCYTFDC